MSSLHYWNSPYFYSLPSIFINLAMFLVSATKARPWFIELLSSSL